MLTFKICKCTSIACPQYRSHSCNWMQTERKHIFLPYFRRYTHLTTLKAANVLSLSVHAGAGSYLGPAACLRVIVPFTAAQLHCMPKAASRCKTNNTTVTPAACLRVNDGLLLYSFTLQHQLHREASHHYQLQREGKRAARREGRTTLLAYVKMSPSLP